MKVFLGGTCSGYKWRDKLIPMLSCDYYNPIVKNWQEEDRLREVKEREEADYVLYVITSGMKGFYSIAEVVDDSNKRPEKTLFCMLGKFWDKQVYHSLCAVRNLVKSNGVMVFEDLSDIATFLNEMYWKDELKPKMVDEETFKKITLELFGGDKNGNM